VSSVRMIAGLRICLLGGFASSLRRQRAPTGVVLCVALLAQHWGWGVGSTRCALRFSTAAIPPPAANGRLALVDLAVAALWMQPD